MMTVRLACCLMFGCGWIASSMVCCRALADGPSDNQKSNVRPLPPAGISIDDKVRTELQVGYGVLQKKLQGLKQSKNFTVRQYLPDVLIFEKALQVALYEDGFFEQRDVEHAKHVLELGLKRAEELEAGTFRPSWVLKESIQGFTVRGFRSKIDGSVQPYGVAWNEPSQRADVWCRGRAEKGLELQFIAKQIANPDPLPSPGVLMIYPFGRYCNANKLAGEVDTFEALEHARQEYSFDAKQVAIRGFSMGGAAAWHLAVHYPDRWFAATPGAGFSETPKFLNVFQAETLTPTAYEQTLWNLYDCDKWALNLKNLPTIAYSGAIDRQKQAADVMAEACANLPDGDAFELTHLIAPDTGHKITPEARQDIEERLTAIHSLGRFQQTPRKLWFCTYTLKYNKCYWLTIDRLLQHWQPAIVKTELTVVQGRGTIRISARGVTQLTLELPADALPDEVQEIDVSFQGDPADDLSATRHKLQRRSDLSWRASWRLVTEAGKSAQWQRLDLSDSVGGLHKQPGLQGPIDDAFMSSFIFVRPDKPGFNKSVDAWVSAEMQRAVDQWKRQMRGDVRIVSADQLKDEDLRSNNLVLWGDPLSNPMIKRTLEKTPVKWAESGLVFGNQHFEPEHHIPLMIYPSPFAQSHYVVLNSGFTYREYDYLNNARQVPKLPDWAVVDIKSPPDARWPGRIAAADFFDEAWQFKLPQP